MPKETKKKCILLLGAGSESIPVYQQALQQNLKIIAVDKDRDAPALPLADYFIIESIYSPEAIILKLINLDITINAVVAACTDVPYSVACIGEKFGLATLTKSSARNVSDKWRMKKKFQEADVATAKGIIIDSPNNIGDFEMAFPLVMKPTDSRGARGVFYLESKEDLIKYFPLSRNESKSNTVLVEEYFDGPQISTEGLMLDGKLYNLGFSDRNYEWLSDTKPYMIENGGQYPSTLSDQEQNDVVTVFEKAANSLGIHNGIVKGDMVLHRGQAKVIEIAGRLSGGYFSTVQIPYATGINLVELVIKMSLGIEVLPSDLLPLTSNAVAIRYKKCSPGKVVNILDVDSLEQAPNLIYSGVFLKPGDIVNELTNHTDRAAFAITGGDNSQQAVDAANRSLHHLKIELAEQS